MGQIELLRKRVAARGWLTRTVKSLQGILEAEVPDQDALQVAKVNCEKRLQILDEIQSEVELCFETEDEMLADIESAADVRDKVIFVLSKAGKALKDKVSSVGSVSQGEHLRLPKLELTTFSGDVLLWQAFWECFEVSVHHADLPEVTKFAYLRSVLHGDAKDCVAGLALTAANYGSACDLLQNRFGRKEVITFSHIQQLLSVPESRSSSVQSLRELQDRLLIHIRSLESLGITGDKYGVVLVPLILSKLSPDVRLEWAREGSGKEADLGWLLTFLASEIERRERSSAYGSMHMAQGQQLAASAAEERHKATSGPQHRRKREQWQRTPAAAALQTGGRPVCGFCGQAHQAKVCHTLNPLSVPERRDAIRQAGLCFRCLKTGHVARKCDTVCSECGGNHSVVCCHKLHGVVVQGPTGQGPTGQGPTGQGPTGQGPTGQGPTGRGPTGGSAQCPSLSCKSAGHEQRCTVLPTACVIVVGKGGQRVEATVLFDTGSDRTYVSERLVRRAEPEWVGSESMAYAAFGGTGSAAEQRDVYRVDMFGSNMASPSVLSVQAIRIPVICTPLQRPVLPAGVLQSLSHLELADPPSDRQLTVDILNNKSFYIRNQSVFSMELLPVYYKHNNMASFVRQLNMYGFRKVLSPMAGSLRNESDEMIFAHPDFVKDETWGLENIKRKIAHHKDLPSASSELMARLYGEVKTMKGKQDSLDGHLSKMKRENESLWREVLVLRQKHSKQQQIVNKLIQFLVSFVQPGRGATSSMGLKRKQLPMLEDSGGVGGGDQTGGPSAKAPRLARTFSMDENVAANIDNRTITSNAGSPGPVIHDVTDQVTSPVGSVVIGSNSASPQLPINFMASPGRSASPSTVDWTPLADTLAGPSSAFVSTQPRSQQQTDDDEEEAPQQDAQQQQQQQEQQLQQQEQQHQQLQQEQQQLRQQLQQQQDTTVALAAADPNQLALAAADPNQEPTPVMCDSLLESIQADLDGLRGLIGSPNWRLDTSSVQNILQDPDPALTSTSACGGAEPDHQLISYNPSLLDLFTTESDELFPDLRGMEEEEAAADAAAAPATAATAPAPAATATATATATLSHSGLNTPTMEMREPVFPGATVMGGRRSGLNTPTMEVPRTPFPPPPSKASKRDAKRRK